MLESIVTVTFDRDKYFMELQSYTLNKYWTVPHVHYVIIEDTDDLAFYDDLLKKYYTTHTLRLITRNIYPYLYCKDYKKLSFRGSPGYYEQMLLKLKISSMIQTSHYLVLDSKNYFFNYIDYEYIPVEGGGKPFHRSNAALQEWIKFADAFSLFANKPLPEYLTFPATPVIMNTDSVRRLLSYNFESFFIEYFQKHNGVSEFIAYEIFTDYSKNNYGVCGSNQFNNIISSFNRRNISNQKEIDIFKENLKNIDQSIVEKALKSLIHHQ